MKIRGIGWSGSEGVVGLRESDVVVQNIYPSSSNRKLVSVH